jgi:hypothetical protein
MTATSSTEQSHARKRFAVDQSVEGFHLVHDLCDLVRTRVDQFYPICGSAKAGEQTPIFQADKLPEEIVSEHFDYPDPPPVNIYVVADCAIGGGGLLVKKDQIWLPSDCYPGYFARMFDQAGGHIPDNWAGSLNAATPCVVRYDLPCALPLHPNLVYGHFLMEILPKLYLLRIIRDMGVDYQVVIHRTVPNWVKTFVDLYFEADDLIWYDMRNDVLLPSVVLSPSMMQQEHSFHPLMNVVAEDVLIRAGISPVLQGQTDRTASLIYLSRTRVVGGWHKIINESDVEDTFRSAGFQIVHPLELSLREQLAIYRNAICIAGQYSSALHNSLFARRGIKVLSLNRINWYQSMITRLRGQYLGFVPPDDGLMRDWRTRGNTPVEYRINCVQLRTYISEFLLWTPVTEPHSPLSGSSG